MANPIVLPSESECDVGGPQTLMTTPNSSLVTMCGMDPAVGIDVDPFVHIMPVDMGLCILCPLPPFGEPGPCIPDHAPRTPPPSFGVNIGGEFVAVAEPTNPAVCAHGGINLPSMSPCVLVDLVPG